MSIIYLERHTDNEMGCFGDAVINDLKFVTVEKPWKNNKPFFSCIPSGEYELVLHESKKYGKTYAMVNEAIGVYHYHSEKSKRYACLIHSANKASQVQGCIAPGSMLGAISGEWAVFNSKRTLHSILDELPATESHSIIITWKQHNDRQ